MKNENTPSLEKNINPTKLWKVYGSCLGISFLAGFFGEVLQVDPEILSAIYGILDGVSSICIIIAFLCVPCRLVQSAVKQDSAYAAAAGYCALLVATQIALVVILLNFAT
jgi:hypothetical protein